MKSMMRVFLLVGACGLPGCGGSNDEPVGPYGLSEQEANDAIESAVQIAAWRGVNAALDKETRLNSEFSEDAVSADGNETWIVTGQITTSTTGKTQSYKVIVENAEGGLRAKEVYLAGKRVEPAS